MEITKIVSDVSRNVIIDSLNNRIKNLGFDSFVRPTDSKITISDVRLGDKWVAEKGYNVSPYTGRKGRVLGWKNWVQVNNTVNKVLDELDVSANVSSLHGEFIIRKGKEKFTEDDWEDKAYDNVGSVIKPVYRKDAWLSEKDYELWKAKKLAEVL